MKHPFAWQQPIIFVGGKGGVGKTTLSSALSVYLSRQGKKVLLVSTDPAHSLSDVFNKKIGNKIKNIKSNLHALELDPREITKRHFKNIETTLRSYSSPEMFGKIQEYLNLAMSSPGAEEAALLEAMSELLVNRQDFEHIIFDTAPSGHTIRLLGLPTFMSAWSNGLLKKQKQQEQFKQAAKVLWQKTDKPLYAKFSPNRDSRVQQAEKILTKRKELFNDARKILSDKKQTAIIFVMTAQKLPLEETLRTSKELKKFNLSFDSLFINQVISQKQEDVFWQKQADRQKEILSAIKGKFKKTHKFYFYLSQKDLQGFEALTSLSDTSSFFIS